MKSEKGKISPDAEEKIVRYFEEAQKTSSNIADTEFADDKIYQRIQNSIAKKQQKTIWLKHLYRSAAVLLLIGMMGGAFVYYYKTNEKLLMAMQEKTTAPGTISKITLPDGSRIWLNAGSKLSFPKRFNKDKREVHLDGEAFFEVKHESKRPFLIYSQGTVTQVLGTSFNVSSYPQDNQVKVSVVSGKVAVYEQVRPGSKQKIDPIFLTANQQGVFNKEQTSFMLDKNEVKSADAAAWREGQLVFKGTELSEVIRHLERRYAIRIDMDAELKCPITVNFNNEPLERAIRVLERLTNGQVDYENGKYKLTGVNCQ